MGTNRVGDEIIKRMIADGCFAVCSLDGMMNDVAYDLELPLWKGMNPHPLNRMRVATSYLRRDDRFSRGLIHAHDCNARVRRLQLFRLKPEYQP